MPRIALDSNRRVSLQVAPEQKAMLMRAAALRNTDLTDFIVRHALREVETVIAQAEHMKLSGRDSLRVLDLLENPPAPKSGLLAAAKALS